MRRLLVVVAAAALLFAGCSDDGEVSSPGADVVLRVIDGYTVARDWTLTDLEAEVPFTEVVVDGDAQTGDPIVLERVAVAVSPFQFVRVHPRRPGLVGHQHELVDAGDNIRVPERFF